MKHTCETDPTRSCDACADDPMAYYVTEIHYVGPYDEQRIDEHLVHIQREPARGNLDNEPITRGWCGTTNDYALHAHGVFPTVEKAREAVKALQEAEGWGGLRELEPYDLEDDLLVEGWRVGKLAPLSKSATSEWLYDAIQREVTVDTNVDGYVEACVATCESECQCALDADTAREMVEERITELKDKKSENPV